MTATATVADQPLPAGFGLDLDPATREVTPGTFCGGEPFRVLRLTDAGRPAWAELTQGPVATRAAGLLARRFTDAGLAHPVPPPVTAELDLTVVVPVHDRAAALDRCLAALGRRYPVLVVDDASRDGGPVARVTERHGARLLRRELNGGPAGARNTGLAAVESELVAFVDSDTVPDGDWLPRLAAHLHDPSVVAVAPRITPVAGAGWSGRFAAAHCPLDLGDRPAAVRPYGRVSYVPSTALLCRRAALPAFDPALRVGEDVDLVWRLLAGGARIRYEPAVTVRHVEPRGWGSLLARRFRYGTSTAALARRHPGNVAPLIVQPWFAVAAVGGLGLRPAVAAAGFAGCLLDTRRTVRRAGLPTRGLVRPTLGGVGRTWLGLGRYATQFAAPAVLAALVSGSARRRFAAAGLLLGPALTGWWRSDRGLDPARYAAGSILDDLAYGAGVLAGCVRQRTARPLLPKTIIRSPRW